jgi:signal peptidase I
MKKIGLQGRWPKTLFVFFLPFILFYLIRSFFLEPFVIPSESMLPNLMIHDHILVNKNTYGLRSLFSDSWWIKFQSPKRGDVVVFRYPENLNVFFIKRLIGLPGDQIKVRGMSLKVNDKLYSLEPDFEPNLFFENNGEKAYKIAFLSDSDRDESLDSEEKIFTVPDHSYFVMGDNRYNSHDSRFWGFVPDQLLIGKAQYIWMSCEDTLESAPFICNPQTFRFNRFLQKID